MFKLSKCIRVDAAAESLNVSQTTLGKCADTGVIPCRTRLARGHRPIRNAEMRRILRDAAKPASRGRKAK